MELLIIVVLALCLIPVVIFTSGVFRIVLGLVFILFFPGYTLVAALFPKKDSLGDVERFALSFGLSIVIVPLIGLILNYTSWGITLYPVIISLLIFIVLMSVVAWYRRHKLLDEERFTARFISDLFNSFYFLRLQSGWDKLLTIVLVISIVGAIGTVVYVVTMPNNEEAFTEFYMLDLEGGTENYPQEITLGAEGSVILGITNQEREITSYTVKIYVDGELDNQIASISLNDDETWEQAVSFSTVQIGEDQKVEFLLYKGDGNTDYYLELHLWIDVIETS